MRGHPESITFSLHAVGLHTSGDGSAAGVTHLRFNNPEPHLLRGSLRLLDGRVFSLVDGFAQRVIAGLTSAGSSGATVLVPPGFRDVVPALPALPPGVLKDEATERHWSEVALSACLL
jgi:hypothetical protein